VKAVLQRVSSAHVSVHGEVVGEIDAGLLVLAGVGAVVVRTRRGPGVDD
jgi:D-Tyr-tRNAtyr deacylase